MCGEGSPDNPGIMNQSGEILSPQKLESYKDILKEISLDIDNVIGKLNTEEFKENALTKYNMESLRIYDTSVATYEMIKADLTSFLEGNGSAFSLDYLLGLLLDCSQTKNDRKLMRLKLVEFFKELLFHKSTRINTILQANGINIYIYIYCSNIKWLILKESKILF